MTSKKLSLELGIKHYNLKRDVFRIIERNKKFEKEIEITNYICRGKKYEDIKLSENMVRIIKEKKEFRNANSSIEKEYLKIISNIFPNLKKEYQKCFLNGKYKVDLFIEELNMVIEINEKEHLHRKEFDILKRKEVTNELFYKVKEECKHINGENFDYKNFISYVEVEEGKLGEGIRNILLEIQRTTQSNVISFIK